MKLFFARFKILILRSIDSVVGISWGFLLLWGATLACPKEELPTVLSLIAATNAFLLLDAGISGSQYAKTRAAYLSGNTEHFPAYKRTAAFFSFAGFVVFLITVICSAGMLNSINSRFFVIACGLSVAPMLLWGFTGATLRAKDEHFRFFIFELIRKSVSVLGPALIIFDSRFTAAFPVIVAVSWASCYRYASSVKAVLIEGDTSRRSPGEPTEFFGVDRTASTFSVVDFLVQQSPYLMLQYMMDPSTSIVMFDIFNKIRRTTAVVSNLLHDHWSGNYTDHYYSKGHGIYLSTLAKMLPVVFIISVTLSVCGAVVFIFLAERLVKDVKFDFVSLFISVAIGALLFFVRSFSGQLLMYTGKIFCLLQSSAVEFLFLAGAFVVLLSQDHSFVGIETGAIIYFCSAGIGAIIQCLYALKPYPSKNFF